MITKFAIKKFLERPRVDWRSFKKLTDDELEAHKDQLPVTPPIWYKLTHRQKVCFIIGAKTSRFFFMNGTGTGKTLLSVALIRYFRKLKKVRRALVLIPNKINKAEWRREIIKHSPKTSVLVLTGSSANKWKQLEGNELIVADSYAGFARMCCEVKEVKRRRKLVSKLIPVPALIKRITTAFDGLIMDESIFVGNKKTLPYRLCRQISKNANMVFALNGTPFGKDPIQIWSQVNLIDHGYTLGETMGLFREAFYSSKENYWGGQEFTFLKKNQLELNRLLANRAIRFVAEKNELPQLREYIKYASLPMDAQAYYDQAKAELKAARGNYTETKSAFIRMRQISSGFVGYNDDESGTRAKFTFNKNPKLDLLIDVIQQRPPGFKIIVYHDFVYSGELIAKRFIKEGIGFLQLDKKVKDHDQLLKDFDDDETRQVFLVNNARGAFGTNLQIAKYGIYYECPLSAIIRKQSLARFVRTGSEHEWVAQYDLITRGTWDMRILNSHATGTNLFRSIIEGRIPFA